MITSLRLQQFRSYQDESFEFEPGVTIIVGPNASGKTNLLEAILVLARGHSYRVDDDELIMFDKPWARVDAVLADGQERTIKLDMSAGRLDKSMAIDGRKYKILPHNHVMPAVLFEPNHLQLLNGSPDLRRNYLDDLLSQLQPGFTSMRQHYRRALSQRNALLKMGYQRARSQVFAWDLRLSELGGHIAETRMDLLESLASDITELYKAISHARTSVTLEYHSSLPARSYASALLHKLEHSLETDCERGFTAYGPHRDDMAVLFDGKPANLTASRGESRTTMLALKILELKLLEEKTGRKPLLLLDDVFSELDGARRKALTAYLRDYQTFITTTDADVVMQYFMEAGRVIPLGQD
jgi:DNA replication and repair protein RecF